MEHKYPTDPDKLKEFIADVMFLARQLYMDGAFHMPGDCFAAAEKFVFFSRRYEQDLLKRPADVQPDGPKPNIVMLKKLANAQEYRLKSQIVPETSEASNPMDATSPEQHLENNRTRIMLIDVFSELTKNELHALHDYYQRLSEATLFLGIKPLSFGEKMRFDVIKSLL